MYYNTLDLDSNDKEFIEMILNKIKHKSCLISLKSKFSLQKGVHIKMLCEHKCELCRLVFDDTYRYQFDGDRPIYSQNVLFDTKEFH